MRSFIHSFNRPIASGQKPPPGRLRKLTTNQWIYGKTNANNCLKPGTRSDSKHSCRTCCCLDSRPDFVSKTARLRGRALRCRSRPKGSGQQETERHSRTGNGTCRSAACDKPRSSRVERQASDALNLSRNMARPTVRHSSVPGVNRARGPAAPGGGGVSPKRAGKRARRLTTKQVAGRTRGNSDV